MQDDSIQCLTFDGPPNHFLLFFGCLDEAWVGPAGAKVVVQQSGGVQSEQDLNCGTGPMWGQRSRNSSFISLNKRIQYHTLH